MMAEEMEQRLYRESTVHADFTCDGVWDMMIGRALASTNPGIWRRDKDKRIVA
jgi:hypothetical protein